MRNLIYGLRDPRNDMIYYVGKTTTGVKRPLSHRTHSHNKEVSNWVNELNKQGTEIIIDVIEDNIELGELQNRENYWIGEYKELNPNLFNLNSLHSNLISIPELDKKDIPMIYDFLNDIPRFIKLIRLKYKLTQAQLAKMCNVDRGTLSLSETNRYYNTGTRLLRTILQVISDLDTPEEKKHIRINRVMGCEHPYHRLHWVGTTVYCNQCGSTLQK